MQHAATPAVAHHPPMHPALLRARADRRRRRSLRRMSWRAVRSHIRHRMAHAARLAHPLIQASRPCCHTGRAPSLQDGHSHSGASSLRGTSPLDTGLQGGTERHMHGRSVRVVRHIRHRTRSASSPSSPRRGRRQLPWRRPRRRRFVTLRPPRLPAAPGPRQLSPRPRASAPPHRRPRRPHRRSGILRRDMAACTSASRSAAVDHTAFRTTPRLLHDTARRRECRDRPHTAPPSPQCTEGTLLRLRHCRWRRRSRPTSRPSPAVPRPEASGTCAMAAARGRRDEAARTRSRTAAATSRIRWAALSWSHRRRSAAARCCRRWRTARRGPCGTNCRPCGVRRQGGAHSGGDTCVPGLDPPDQAPPARATLHRRQRHPRRHRRQCAQGRAARPRPQHGARPSLATRRGGRRPCCGCVPRRLPRWTEQWTRWAQRHGPQ